MKDGKHSLRIAFVSTMTGVAWGGSEELWCQTALHLRTLGHEIYVSVFDWGHRPSLIAELEAKGAHMNYRVRKPKLVVRILEKIRNKLTPRALSHSDYNWLKKIAPDLVVISQGYPLEGICWMKACKSQGIRYSPIVHANSEIWWPEDAELVSFQNAYLHAERIFFVSNSNHHLMEMQVGAPLSNSEIIINPWKVNADEPVPWPADDGVFRIACVGRIDPRAKGHDLLLKVMTMPKWKARPLQMNFYGEGPCENSIKALARHLDVSHVNFKGQVSDVRKIWAENHALILPSRFEGLPLVIVEAMFCGRMVITTDVAGNGQYIADGVEGFIAAAPACVLVEDAMERAWARKSEWEAIGLLARKRVMTEIPKNPIEVFSKKIGQLADPI